jgi:hypothetical protein
MSERPSQLHQQLQRQVVRVVEEGDRPVGEGRQRPGAVELAPADPRPGVHLQQHPGVLQDGDARGRAGALLVEPGLGAEHPGARRGPQVQQPPGGGGHQGRGQQQQAPAAGQFAVQQSPQQQQRHAEPQAGARGREHHAEHQQEQHQRALACAPLATHAQPDPGHGRHQQQGGEVVGLAHIAHRATDETAARNPLPVGPVRQEDLHQAERQSGQSGQQQAQAQALVELGRVAARRQGQQQQRGQQEHQRHAVLQAVRAEHGQPGGERQAQRGQQRRARRPGSKQPGVRADAQQGRPQAQRQQLVVERRGRAAVVGQQRGQQAGQQQQRAAQMGECGHRSGPARASAARGIVQGRGQGAGQRGSLPSAQARRKSRCTARLPRCTLLPHCCSQRAGALPSPAASPAS